MKTLPIYIAGITLIIFASSTTFSAQERNAGQAYTYEMPADTTLLPAWALNDGLAEDIEPAAETTYSQCTPKGCRVKSFSDTLYNFKNLLPARQHNEQ